MSDRGLLARFKQFVASANSFHRPDGRPNVFIFSAPRAGSTWLAELVATQPGFKPCDEPFNLRSPNVAEALGRLGIHSWSELYSRNAEPAVRAYVQAIVDGSSGHMDPFFYRNHFRLITHRIVFKILHAGEDRIAWFRDCFNGRVVLLVRHPIPVTLSRRVLPRLQAFIESDYAEAFSEEERRFARTILRSGTKHEKGVLDWCLQYAVPLRQATEDWAIVSYEQLVLDPHPVISLLVKRLDLPKPEAMMRRLVVPSSSSHQSDASSQHVLQSRDDSNRSRWLVEKWRSQVDESEERRLIDILVQFGIDFYEAGSPIPTPRYWLAGRGVSSEKRHSPPVP